MRIEETLQNQHRSDLVDDFPMFREGASGGVQVPMGLGRGEALIPEVNGEREGLAEGLGKEVGFGGLRADIAGHIEGVADDDGGAAEFALQAAEGFEVLTHVFADKGENRLGGEAEFVGDSDADAAVSEIEAQEAGLHNFILARGQTESRILEWVRESKGH